MLLCPPVAVLVWGLRGVSIDNAQSLNVVLPARNRLPYFLPAENKKKILAMFGNNIPRKRVSLDGIFLSTKYIRSTNAVKCI